MRTGRPHAARIAAAVAGSDVSRLAASASIFKALLIETSNGYARGLLRGIHGYIQEHDSWTTYLMEQGRGEAPPRW